MKFTHETKSVHRVHVEFSGGQVREMLLDRVSEKLHLDRDAVREHLRVDVTGEASGTTYVRGEVPMTRDEQLAALGLTPTEPVETDGAAVAQDLGDHVVGTSDVAETPETVAAFEALAGDPNQILSGESDDLASRPAYVGRVSAEEVAHFKHVAERSLLADPTDPTALSLAKVVAALERPWPTGVSPQVSEELPEVQVDRPESPATLTVGHVLNDLQSLNGLLGQAYEADMPSATLEHAISHLALLFSVLQKYKDCMLVEGGEPQRLVPRPVSEDNLRQARLKLVELADGPRHELGRATATELHYVLSLLGGEL